MCTGEWPIPQGWRKIMCGNVTCYQPPVGEKVYFAVTGYGGANKRTPVISYTWDYTMNTCTYDDNTAGDTP